LNQKPQQVDQSINRLEDLCLVCIQSWVTFFRLRLHSCFSLWDSWYAKFERWTPTSVRTPKTSR